MGNDHHYQLVHHLLSTFTVGIRDTLTPFKTNLWVPKYIFFLANVKEKGRPCFGESMGNEAWDYPLEHLVVIRYWKRFSFYRIQNNFILPSHPTPYWLNPFANKYSTHLSTGTGISTGMYRCVHCIIYYISHIQSWSSMINFVDRF